jgi:hypothetical protein
MSLESIIGVDFVEVVGSKDDAKNGNDQSETENDLENERVLLIDGRDLGLSKNDIDDADCNYDNTEDDHGDSDSSKVFE